MILDVVAVAAGLVLLLGGGEVLVRGSVELAHRLGMSKLVIGLVIVGFGTSMPELLVSLRAALAGTPGIVLGNVIGSNIANVMLVVGTAALIAPLGGWMRDAVRESMVALAVALALYGLIQNGVISRVEGGLLVLALGAYLATSYWQERRERHVSLHEAEAAEFQDLPLRAGWIAPALVASGLATLMLGAELLVGGAVSLARDLGVSEAVIGLSLVAVGTSLPELATAVVASLRGHPEVLLGNVIGSCIFNILAIVGLTAIFSPLDVAARFAQLDGVVMVAALLLMTLLLTLRPAIGRGWGGAMLLGYCAYVAALFLNGAGQ